MPETVELICPNPACPGREVDENGHVDREVWDCAWREATREQPGELGPEDHCPRCSTEGVLTGDPELLEEAEEALGRRCAECGIVTADPDGACPHCGEPFPEQSLAPAPQTPSEPASRDESPNRMETP